MPNRRSGDGVSTARLTVFLTLLAVGMLVGAMLAPRAAWGQSPRQVAVPVAAVWGASVYALGAGNQWHHEYIGAALLLSHKRWVQWVGVGIMADDAVQHLIQTRHPNYRSPLHEAYRLTLYRWVVR